MIDIDMTVDEALEATDICLRGKTVFPGMLGWLVICAVLAKEVRKLREETQWRDVKEELPDEKQEVLCLLKSRLNGDTTQITGCIECGHWFDSWMNEAIGGLFWDVIAWRPLPEESTNEI